MSTQQQPVSAPAPAEVDELPKIDLKPLLSRLWPLGHAQPVAADEIAQAISYFFTNQVSNVQAGSLLMSLHFTGLDRRADVLAKTAQAMLEAAAQIDISALESVIKTNVKRKEGAYNGGLVKNPSPPQNHHPSFPMEEEKPI
jgi:anthranilate phosphoribosyltransferase